MNPTVNFKRLDNGEGLGLPSYETPGSAGADIQAAVAEPQTLQPGERGLIPAGFAMALPQGFEAQVRPRSGLAVKHGLTVLNAPGTIDSDYRGEVAVILINLSQQDFTITSGMRIAQMVIAPVTNCHLEDASCLDISDRGTGGFGSTGL